MIDRMYDLISVEKSLFIKTTPELLRSLAVRMETASLNIEERQVVTAKIAPNVTLIWEPKEPGKSYVEKKTDEIRA